MDNIIAKNKKEKIIGIFLSIFYFLRVIFLDADVKIHNIAQISPTDELYYNELAIKMYKYGFRGILGGTWSETSVANAKTFFIPSLFTGLSMKLLGNNFWAFKLPYVIMGFCIGILLYLCTKFLLPNHKLAHLLVVLAYILDFNIFMLSREAVTVIPCMLACMFTVYGSLKFTNIRLKWLFLGAWSIMSFCLVYMGLPFLIIATGIYFVADFVFEKECRCEKTFSYILGIVLGGLIGEAVSSIFFRQHLTKTIADTLIAHGSKIGGLSVFESIGALIYTGFTYWLSNAFRYNPLILVLGIASLAALLYGILFKKDRYAFVLFIYIFMHWMQTVFLDNMTYSKAAITFPLLLLAVSYSICTYYQELFVKKGIVRNVSLTVLLCIGLGSLVLMYTAYDAHDPILPPVFKYGIGLISIISSVCIFISALTLKKKLMYIPGILTGTLMLTLTINYVFLNPTYTDKTLMQDLGVETNNGIVINGAGFNLYNMCESPVNYYDHYKGIEYNFDTMRQSMVDACYRYDELYLIGSKEVAEELNGLLAKTPYYFETVKTYSRVYRISEDEDYSSCILYKKYIREK